MRPVRDILAGKGYLGRQGISGQIKDVKVDKGCLGRDCCRIKFLSCKCIDVV